jgi:hypothetical protein
MIVQPVAYLRLRAPGVTIPTVAMTEGPNAPTEAELLEAISGLASMVDVESGDLESKATLAVTTYRVAARVNGSAWAEVRIGPIITQLREQGVAAGQQGAIDRILYALPRFVPAERPAPDNLARDVDAMLSSIQPEATDVQPLMAGELQACADQWERAHGEPDVVRATVAEAAWAVEWAKRLIAEVRRLRG